MTPPRSLRYGVGVTHTGLSRQPRGTIPHHGYTCSDDLGGRGTGDRVGGGIVQGTNVVKRTVGCDREPGGGYAKELIARPDGQVGDGWQGECNCSTRTAIGENNPGLFRSKGVVRSFGFDRGLIILSTSF